ncbi:GDP-mannose 4,6-dehydratase [Bombilactobacillus thymidiniphilus]|uniref:GDP-mannose 4,6-dehydratase n=1 Tax=Bombilactobacillus thymidiniphilus TaxID=2923363 RepID=A0ABY4PCJ8_9LACO|nr:GDP-mannose 4,6-dehydratase [Bombilactobacillus thymidiniphilus]UQS83289.1 GDP-mannose 4,6-dehydratase [Bombilactobacillus thymidiniphilus]
MKYLVTGGAGFIGANLVEYLVNANEQVVVVDDLSMGQYQNIAALVGDKLRFYKHSITDDAFMTELLLAEKFDYIILLGAIASVADSIARPMQTHQVNLEANLHILETIRKNQLPLKKLLFASSAAVYGNQGELPKKETSPIDPLSPYAIDKFASERYVINYGKLYGLKTVAVRFFNVYGPKQNPASPYSGVLSIINDCLLNNKKFTMYGDGQQTRDFVYVKDVVIALMLLLNEPTALHDVYNIATGTPTTLTENIMAFEKVWHKKLVVQHEPSRAGDIQYSYANIAKLKALGFTPQYDIQEGLFEYIQQTKK